MMMILVKASAHPNDEKQHFLWITVSEISAATSVEVSADLTVKS